MTFHQVIPHAHHEHQPEKREITHHHHFDEHHHHEDQKEQKENHGFLSYLLAIHSHASSSNEIPLLKNQSENFSFKKIAAKKKFAQEYTSEVWVLTMQELANPEVYHPPKHYFKPYLTILSLRGPPQLV
ncbi:hypothetical protein [Christiangramia crocea]|nr:hypothetical protein [Gramella crocea]